MLVLFMLVLPMTEYSAFFTSTQSGLSLLGTWRLIAALLALLLLGDAFIRKGRRWKILLLLGAGAMIGHQVMYAAIAEASHSWSAAGRVPRSIQDLESINSNLRHDAIGILGWYGADSRAAVPALTRFLEDPSWSFRSGAAHALGAIGPDSHPAVPKLRALARDDPDRRVRDSARRAIERILR